MPKEQANCQTLATCLDLGNELAERILVEFQYPSKGMGFYVNKLDGKCSVNKTTVEEKKAEYSIVCVNDLQSATLLSSETLCLTWVMLFPFTEPRLRRSHG